MYLLHIGIPITTREIPNLNYLPIILCPIINKNITAELELGKTGEYIICKIITYLIGIGTYLHILRS